ncbi:isoamylase early set domain-containing protein [Teredinibacter franksiae]|jgi:Carbohydrate-binding module 48 (Isoamylase N-terminal domain).|uniref:isoamylase early set domain-containing protein n=1 Tax=Teredinibacter franksiae TaxID=2761453 RepID=UPI001626E368|nr:isoamylase early set domain-containing protein [Teredinibacter franksiae]
MSLDKRYLKTKPVCKVKFIAPATLAESAKSIYLAGEFNGWDCSRTPLKKQKDGKYATTLDLATGKEYEYRYVLDGEQWENDFDADKYVPNTCGTDNSVVVV